MTDLICIEEKCVNKNDCPNEFFDFEDAWELERQKVRADAIDEYLSKVKERFNEFLQRELQGIDMCPFDGDCHYLNRNVCCSYCARQIDIVELELIAEILKEQK